MQVMFQQILQWLSESDAMLILTGAGMSADSGIPTYRGENGAWGKVESELDSNITDIMTPKFIQENPLMMWRRFSKGMAYTNQIHPHQGYFILQKWINKYALDHFVVTSNVDRQFAKAGFREENIYEVHGAGGFLQCAQPCWDKVWQCDYSIYSEVNLSLTNLPKCPNCGGLVRPNVYIFQDRSFVASRIKVQKELFQNFLSRNEDKRILLLEIGSGVTVRTIRHLTNRLLRRHRIRAVRINPYDFAIDQPHLSIPLKALEALKSVDMIV